MSGTINQLRTVSNSGKIKSSHTMGISDAWSQPLWEVTVEITHKTKDRLRINWLDAPRSFTKTIKHSVIRTWASIHNKQITIQPLTLNLSDHELTRTLEPFPPRNRKRERTNNAIQIPFGRAPLNSRVGALKPGKSSSDTCLRPVRYLSLGTGDIKFGRSNG